MEPLVKEVLQMHRDLLNEALNRIISLEQFVHRLGENLVLYDGDRKILSTRQLFDTNGGMTESDASNDVKP